MYIKEDKANLNLIWEEETRDVVDMIEIKNNLLIQVDKLTTSYLFVLGEQQGKLVKKWECEYKYDEYLLKKFTEIENKGVYVKVDRTTWNKIEVKNNEVILSKPEKEVLPILNSSNEYPFIAFNLNNDKELEKIKRIKDYPKKTYKIYSPVSNTEKYSIEFDWLSSPRIIGYILPPDGNYPKLIFTNGYAVYWEDDKFVYRPWIEELCTENGEKEIFNLINEDIDNDNNYETLVTQKLDSNWEEPYKEKLWIIDYDE